MKHCLNCGTEADNDAASCLECNRPFASTGGMGEPGAAYASRPTGQLQLNLAAAFAILTLVAGLAALETSYQWAAVILAGAFFSLALILWLTGMVLRAIWFLPGDDTRAV